MESMNIDTIIQNHDRLEHDLRKALTTMERKSVIYDIRKQILANQDKCPHYSQYNWAVVDGICPYCGKQLFNK